MELRQGTATAWLYIALFTSRTLVSTMGSPWQSTPSDARLSTDVL